MFPKDDDKLQIKLSGEYDSQPVSYVLLGTESKELIDLNELDRIARREFAEANGETETDVFDGSSVYMIGEQTLTESIRLNRLTRVTGTLIRLKPQIKISYVSPFEHLNGNIVNRIIKNDAYKLICLNALQLFDPEIEDIMIFRSDVSNRPVEYLKHKRLGNMPLSTYVPYKIGKLQIQGFSEPITSKKIKQSYHITQKAARSRQRAAFLRGKLGRRQKFSKK